MSTYQVTSAAIELLLHGALGTVHSKLYKLTSSESRLVSDLARKLTGHLQNQIDVAPRRQIEEEAKTVCRVLVRLVKELTAPLNTYAGLNPSFLDRLKRSLASAVEIVLQQVDEQRKLAYGRARKRERDAALRDAAARDAGGELAAAAARAVGAAPARAAPLVPTGSTDPAPTALALSVDGEATTEAADGRTMLAPSDLTSLAMPTAVLLRTDLIITFEVTAALTLPVVQADPVFGRLPVCLLGTCVATVACASLEHQTESLRAMKGAAAILLATYDSQCGGQLGPESELAVVLPLATRAYLLHEVRALVFTSAEEGAAGVGPAELESLSTSLAGALLAAKPAPAPPASVLNAMADEDAAKERYETLLRVRRVLEDFTASASAAHSSQLAHDRNRVRLSKKTGLSSTAKRDVPVSGASARVVAAAMVAHCAHAGDPPMRLGAALRQAGIESRLSDPPSTAFPSSRAAATLSAAPAAASAASAARAKPGYGVRGLGPPRGSGPGDAGGDASFAPPTALAAGAGAPYFGKRGLGHFGNGDSELWFEGTVAAVNDNGTLDFAYDDNDFEAGKPRDRVSFAKSHVRGGGEGGGERAYEGFASNGEGAYYRLETTADDAGRAAEPQQRAPLPSSILATGLKRRRASSLGVSFSDTQAAAPAVAVANSPAAVATGPATAAPAPTAAQPRAAFAPALRTSFTNAPPTAAPRLSSHYGLTMVDDPLPFDPTGGPGLWGIPGGLDPAIWRELQRAVNWVVTHCSERLPWMADLLHEDDTGVGIGGAVETSEGLALRLADDLAVPSHGRSMAAHSKFLVELSLPGKAELLMLALSGLRRHYRPTSPTDANGFSLFGLDHVRPKPESWWTGLPATPVKTPADTPPSCRRPMALPRSDLPPPKESVSWTFHSQEVEPGSPGYDVPWRSGDALRSPANASGQMVYAQTGHAVVAFLGEDGSPAELLGQIALANTQRHGLGRCLLLRSLVGSLRDSPTFNPYKTGRLANVPHTPVILVDGACVRLPRALADAASVPGEHFGSALPPDRRLPLSQVLYQTLFSKGSEYGISLSEHPALGAAHLGSGSTSLRDLTEARQYMLVANLTAFASVPYTDGALRLALDLACEMPTKLYELVESAGGSGLSLVNSASTLRFNRVASGLRQLFFGMDYEWHGQDHLLVDGQPCSAAVLALWLACSVRSKAELERGVELYAARRELARHLCSHLASSAGEPKLTLAWQKKFVEKYSLYLPNTSECAQKRSARIAASMPPSLAPTAAPAGGSDDGSADGSAGGSADGSAGGSGSGGDEEENPSAADSSSEAPSSPASSSEGDDSGNDRSFEPPSKKAKPRARRLVVPDESSSGDSCSDDSDASVVSEESETPSRREEMRAAGRDAERDTWISDDGTAAGGSSSDGESEKPAEARLGESDHTDVSESDNTEMGGGSLAVASGVGGPAHVCRVCRLTVPTGAPSVVCDDCGHCVHEWCLNANPTLTFADTCMDCAAPGSY